MPKARSWLWLASQNPRPSQIMYKDKFLNQKSKFNLKIQYLLAHLTYCVCNVFVFAFSELKKNTNIFKEFEIFENVVQEERTIITKKRKPPSPTGTSQKTIYSLTSYLLLRLTCMEILISLKPHWLPMKLFQRNASPKSKTWPNTHICQSEPFRRK